MSLLRLATTRSVSVLPFATRSFSLSAARMADKNPEFDAAHTSASAKGFEKKEQSQEAAYVRQQEAEKLKQLQAKNAQLEKDLASANDKLNKK